MPSKMYIGVDGKARNIAKAYVGIPIVTLTNLIPAINGTTGWEATSGTLAADTSYKKYSANSLRLYGGTSLPEAHICTTTNIPILANHQYYIRNDVYFSSDTTYVRTSCYWPIAEPCVYNSNQTNFSLSKGKWCTISVISNRTAAGHSAGSAPYRIDFDCNYKGGYMYLDGVMVIDLTAAFGSGKEPSKAWCDANIPYFTGSMDVMYEGVTAKARTIVKGYIGIGGVARPCFGGNNELSYYGAITPLSSERSSLAATTVGNYALFGGGSYKSDVDAYNTSLTRSTASALNLAISDIAATTVGNYALFGGGLKSSGLKSETVTAYNTSLTVSTPSVLSQKRYLIAATTVGIYALFGGGTSSNVVDAYNSSLTRSTPTALSVARSSLAATSVGNYALFAGGNASDKSNVVDAYNTSLTRSTPTALSTARSYLAATSVGNYALFGGGSGTYNSDVVDAYDTSLTRTIPTALIGGRSSLTATTVDGFAVFGGGGSTDVVDAYDTSLTRSTPTKLSVARSNFSATTVGNYALFGGGWNGGTNYSTVDAYTT